MVCALKSAAKRGSLFPRFRRHKNTLYEMLTVLLVTALHHTPRDATRRTDTQSHTHTNERTHTPSQPQPRQRVHARRARAQPYLHSCTLETAVSHTACNICWSTFSPIRGESACKKRLVPHSVEFDSCQCPRTRPGLLPTALLPWIAAAAGAFRLQPGAAAAPRGGCSRRADEGCLRATSQLKAAKRPADSRPAALPSLRARSASHSFKHWATFNVAMPLDA